MVELIGRVLEKYGTPMMVLRSAQSWEIRAFLQPANSKSWQNMLPEVVALGQVPGGQYVFIGPVDTVREGDTLVLAEKKHRIQRLDTVFYGSQAVYCWGLCTRSGEEDTWGM